MCVSRSFLLAAFFLQGADALAADRSIKAAPAVTMLPAVCVRSEPSPGTPEVPGGDIFGMLSPSDIGDPCSLSYAAEITGRTGKRDGRYVATTKKSQLTYTHSQQLSFAASPFVSAFQWKDVGGNHDALKGAGAGVERSSLNTVDFDGVSFEASWRVLSRSLQQPLAVTLSTEPRWFRRDAITGYRADSGQVELKLFADIALSEHWFVAVNANYGFGTQRLKIPRAELQKGSAYGVATALTFQAWKDETAAVQAVFIGVEARYVQGFSGLTLNFRVGEALFAGPTLAIAFKGGSMLNLVWSPQLGGHAWPPSAPGPLDCDNFERHQFRIKFATPL
ncbi:hypothetical protein [Bradyrhizobium sp. LHD-71]|uniref:hypothetical protein n=1 Tax=Bradyrhizobium sp. LHD-71 TaxID=3072141 RepID=UPI00280FE12E|nr:hypothetical protein [Bradyrhizobium sp. LHD-71]MDQ8726618.1 hypothetical protein [Bradyrhizobium sp. LHD-71]